MTEFVRQLILASCQEQFAKSIDFPWLFTSAHVRLIVDTYTDLSR